MAVDLRTNPWKFDATAQGEGLANADSQMLIATVAPEADDEIFTMSGHNMSTGWGPVQLAGTTAPAGLAKLTDYWVIKIDADTFYLASSYANAMAGTNLTYTTDGTSVTVTQLPKFPIPIYVKNIVVVGDGANEGSILINEYSTGPIVAAAEIEVETNESVIPIYGYVQGLYVTTLDASGAVILVYHGKA